MASSKDNRIISLWLQRQPSPHTRGCYQRDSKLLESLGTRVLAGVAHFILPGTQPLVSAQLSHARAGVHVTNAISDQKLSAGELPQEALCRGWRMKTGFWLAQAAP